MGYREGDPPEQSKLGQITGEEIWWFARKYTEESNVGPEIAISKKIKCEVAFTKAESYYTAKSKFPFDCHPMKVTDEITLAILDRKALWHM